MTQFAPPLGPQEIQVLTMLHQRASANNQMPVGLLATVSPPDNATRHYNNIPFRETDVVKPKPWMAVDPNIGYLLNDRIVSLNNPAINVENITRLGFDVPSSVYALVATAIDTTGAGFPVGQDARDFFQIQFELSNGQRWQTLPALGSTVTGPAQFPRLLGRPAWQLNNGAVLLARITPLRANLRIDVNLWTIEQPGPTNIATG